MKIEEVYKLWLGEYKDFVNNNSNFIILSNKIHMRLEDIKAQMDKFHVEVAMTMRTRIDGVFKTVAKMQKSGRTVFFEDGSDIPTELGKKVFLLSFKELVSRKGNAYILCESWTDEDPLEKLRLEEETLKREMTRVVSIFKAVIEGLDARKKVFKTIKLLKKFDDKTGNWNILLVASKYIPVLDSIRDKFDIITVYNLQDVLKFHFVFKNDKMSFIYEIDKEFDFYTDELDSNLFKMERTSSGFMIKFLTMIYASETKQEDLEVEVLHANDIIYDFVSKERTVDPIQQKV